MAFEKAFNAGDAKAIAVQFAENAEVVDEDGGVVEGRANIEARFAELFKNSPKAQVAVEVTSLRQLSTDVAVEDGISTVTLEPQTTASSSPYTLVYLKRDDKWLIGSVRDLPAESTETAHDHLQELAWLVGHWVDESREGRVETTYHWSEDGNYLLQDYVAKTRRGMELNGTQRIAWDPLRRKIRGWVFDHNGAIVESTWTRVGDTWIIKAEGSLPDGQAASAIRVLTPLTGDSFQIDTSNLIVGNERLPDSTVRVVRQPPAPAK